MFVRPIWIVYGLWVVSSNAQVTDEDVVIDLDDPVGEVGPEEEDSPRILGRIETDLDQEDNRSDHDAEAVSDKDDVFDTSDGSVSIEDEMASDTTIDEEEDSNAEPSPIIKNAEDETTNNENESIDSDSALDGDIRDALESLTNDELEAVCLERGFEIRKGDGTPITRQDLLEAAARCLKLEEEMNTVLDENPELALELDAEIERMKEEKERLEAEQAAMLEEKTLVEERLRQAGVDPGPAVKKSSDGASLTAKSTDTPESLEEVLRTSFTMLFERVGNDIMLVGKVLGFVIKPAAGTMALTWRYVGPTVEGFVQQGIVLVDSLLSTAPAVAVRGVVENQLVPVQNMLWPIAKTTAQQAMIVTKLGLDKLNAIEPAHKIFVFGGAILGPLKNSILIGWHNTLRPNLAVIRRKSGAWFRRLRDDVKAKAKS